MKVSEAKTKVCPFISTPTELTNCICEACMFWETTINGKKELDRQIEPYDMTPMNIGNWCRRMKADGYVNIGRDGGFRDVYVKYEETYEGYCKRLGQ